MKKKFFIYIILFVASFCLCNIVLATTTPVSDPFAGVTRISDYKQIEANSIPDLIGGVIKTVIGVIGSIALVMFVYGGLLWMTASGNSEQQKKAMNVLLWSSLGIVAILASFVIVSFIFKAFGIE